jgi:adenosylhomocysteine nucleosidase
MMSKRIILFVALQSELPKDKIPDGVEVYYTGVGKVNAAIKAAEVIFTARTFGATRSDILVLNYGSAGSNTLPKGTLADCKYFIQQDMNTPFGKQHSTPFDELLYPHITEPTIEFGTGYVCRTQDRFENNPQGIFDMEAYAIAKVCKINGFDFTAYKYISDSGDESDWEENHDKGADLFLKELNKILNE